MAAPIEARRGASRLDMPLNIAPRHVRTGRASTPKSNRAFYNGEKFINLCRLPRAGRRHVLVFLCGIPADTVIKSLERFAKHVMPAFTVETPSVAR